MVGLDLSKDYILKSLIGLLLYIASPAHLMVDARYKREPLFYKIKTVRY